MAKQLNVDLRFTADTSQAKKAIQDLQNTLSNLSLLGTQASTTGFTKEIAEATIEANKLKVALDSAMNVKTGTLDLSKLQQSLRQTGSSIQQVSDSFIKMGPVGQAAFQQFAQAMVQAQAPTMRLNGILNEMFVTIKNVARFQISSSIIHGLIGGVQSAFHYAQNLNESLNNIRIVTGDSAEKMAEFARQANATAKALSATTLDYTNASLIYYQQGLDDQAVKARTDVTVKLANVTRQSAEEVSSQMTAIWNNFDDGAHSMEYFADVITALGATTASSSAEIAQGLQKFAPIAGTIGLSYEKATAALAAIIATTRQSADTVGTGLRTIFSRFESLKLGETLEDGVDLNKYTNAMKTIGVNVLDANGKLREMDDILDDIAENWQKLDNTQKTAFATTVGGVRQYTNLMALFENWDKVQQNLVTATGAEGTLQGQADIYAESWEAARDRVQTALQGLYDTLINDDGFIKILNTIEKLISGIDEFVQRLGGTKGIIIGLGAAITSLANPAIANMFSNLSYNIKSITGIQSLLDKKMINQIMDTASGLQSTNNVTTLQSIQLQTSKDHLDIQREINKEASHYNDIQREVAQNLLQQHNQYANNLIQAQEAQQQAKLQVEVVREQIRLEQQQHIDTVAFEQSLQQNGLAQTAENFHITTGAAKRLADAIVELNAATTAGTEANNAYAAATKQIRESIKLNNETITGAQLLANMTSATMGAMFAIQSITTAVNTFGDSSASSSQKLSALLSVFMGLRFALPSIIKLVKSFNMTLAGTNIAAGPIVLVIGAIAAAIALYHSYLQKLDNAEKALARAENAANNFSNSYDELKTKNENLKSSFDNYDTIYSALNSCTKFSKEWYENLDKVHEATLSIIEDYPELLQYPGLISRDENGQGYTINTSAREQFIKEQQQQELQAQMLSIMSKQALSQAQVNYKLESIQTQANKIFNRSNNPDWLNSTEQKTTGKDFVEFLLSSLSEEELRTLKIDNNFAEAFSSFMLQSGYRENLIQIYGDDLDNTLVNFAERLTSSFFNVVDSLIDYTEQQEKVENSYNTAGEVVADNYLQSQGYEDIIIRTMASRTYPEILKQVTEENAISISWMREMAEYWLPDKLGEGVLDNYDYLLTHFNEGTNAYGLIAFINKYLEAAQDKNLVINRDNMFKRDNGNIKINFVNQAGEVLPTSVTEMLETIAQFESLKQLDDKANETVSIIDNFNKNFSSIFSQKEAAHLKEGFKSFLYTLNFGENLSWNDYEALLQNGDLSNTLSSLFGLENDIARQNFAEALNLKDWNEVLSVIKNEITTGRSDITENIQLLEYYNPFLRFKRGFINNVSDFSLSNLSNIYGNLQDYGDNDLLSQLNLLLSNATNEEQLNSIINLFSKTNLAASDMAQLLQQLQIAPEDFNVIEFVHKINLMQEAINGLNITNFTTSMAAIQAILDKQYGAGAQIKQTDIQPLVDYFGEEFFKPLGIFDSSGNFFVTADANTFNGSLQQQKNQSQENQIKNVIASQNKPKYSTNATNTYESLLAAFEQESPYLDSTLGEGTTEAFIKRFQEEYKAAQTNAEQIELLNTARTILNEAIQEHYNEDYPKRLHETGVEIASTATNYQYLLSLMHQYPEVFGEIEDAEKEVYLQGAVLRQAALEGLNPEEVREYALGLADAADTFSQESLSELEEYSRALLLRNKAITDLKDNYENWLKILKQGKKTDSEWITTNNKLKRSLAAILDIPLENVSEELAEWARQGDNLERLLNGDKNAWAQVFSKNVETYLKSLKQLNNTDFKSNSAIQGLLGNAEQAAQYNLGDSVDQQLVSDTIDKIQQLRQEVGLTDEEANRLFQDTLNTEDNFIVHFEADAGDWSNLQAQLNSIPEGSTFTLRYAQDGEIITQPLPGGGDFSVNNGVISWEDDEGNRHEANVTGGYSIDGEIQNPVVESKGTGGNNNGGKKSGGGGGSKAKSHTRKERDNNDRYKPIRAKQSDKKRQIDAAKDRADRLAGKARIDNLREENKLLGDNIALQQQYIQEITNYLDKDKSDMLKQLGSFGLSINFDENGVINNYDAIMDKLYAIYNQKADQAMDEDAWKEFEESWQKAIDSVNQYIETRDLEEEQQQTLTDMLNEQFDQLLEIVNTELEFNLQVNDADLQLLDHLLNKIDDDAYKAAEAIALMGDKAAKELERANYYQGAINSTLAGYGLDSVDQLLNMAPEELQGLGITQDTVDNLIDWNNELLDITETLDDLQKEIREKVIDTFDELNEKVQDSYDFFSHYNTLLESYRNIADLNTAAIGKESRELIRMLDNSMLRNSQNALRSSKQIYDKLVEDRQIAQQKLQEAEEQGLIGEADAYRDLIEDIDGQIRDAQEQWLADWEDGLEKAKDILERSVEDAVKNYEELLAPLYGSLDALNDVYEMRKEVDADYVQDYEKLYQLNKLNRDLEKTLNDVQGIQNRKQLLALQEKINKLQKDGTKMSEYDLEVLEKEFEVQQARIALEEAANAKSTVRLQRDNEGNWGYVYAADADTIEEAQQNYEDKLYEYQKLNDEYIREMSDKLMELSSTAKEKIAEVWADSTLSPEEKQAKTDEIVAWFNAQRDFIGSQMQNALDNQQNLTQRFYDTYQNTYAEVMDTYQETMLAEATKIDNLNEWLATLSTGFNNLLDEVQVASDVYLEHIAETNEAAGSSIEDLASDITEAATIIDEASLQNVENIEELAQAVQDGLVNALDSAIEQEARLAQQIADTTTQIEEQYQAWDNVLRVLNNVGNAAAAAYYPLDTLARSTEQYGISQPSYNPDDWIANEQISEIFDEIYNQDYWQQQHQYADELQDAIQEWMSLLSMQALTAMGGFGTLTSPYYQEAEDGTLQQEVHIEANFPGVTDRSQIEEAFENLVNKAAQFANRKRQG